MTRLPDFLVIGAYKSGTTALHHDLRSHPRVFLPRRKEPNFFAFEGESADSHPAASSSARSMDEYVALFADAAQVNDFQDPASPDNPMVEEWYYVDANQFNQPNGHFRHAQQANVAFADGHVALEKAVTGSFDKRLPNQFIGQLRPEILTVP